MKNNSEKMKKWSVVACDQYTSEREYWDRVKNYVGDSPSTLNIVYPEAYLSEGDARIEKINSYMDKYLKSDIFKEYKDASKRLKTSEFILSASFIIISQYSCIAVSSSLTFILRPSA